MLHAAKIATYLILVFGNVYSAFWDLSCSPRLSRYLTGPHEGCTTISSLWLRPEEAISWCRCSSWSPPYCCRVQGLPGCEDAPCFSFLVTLGAAWQGSSCWTQSRLAPPTMLFLFANADTLPSSQQATQRAGCWPPPSGTQQMSNDLRLLRN